MSMTFVIIKPDAISRGLMGEIISRFERKGLHISRIESRHKSAAWCREHYSHILAEHPDVYIVLELFMTDQAIVGIIITGKSAIKVVRTMTGCTNSLDALPGTIRGDYGTDPKYENLIHASDSVEAAIKEISLFFDTAMDFET